MPKIAKCRVFLCCHIQKSQRGSFFFPVVEMPPRSACCETAGSHYIVVQHSQVILPLLHYKWCPGSFLVSLILCEVSVQVFVVHVRVQAKNSNCGEVLQFNRLLGDLMLLPFHSYVIMRFCWRRHCNQQISIAHVGLNLYCML